MADPQKTPPTTAPFDATPKPGSSLLPVHVGRSNYDSARRFIGGIPKEDFDAFIMGEPDRKTAHYGLKRMEKERQEQLQAARDSEAEEADEGDGLDGLEELERRVENGEDGDGEGLEEDQDESDTTAASPRHTGPPISRFNPNLDYSADALRAAPTTTADALARWRPHGDPDHDDQETPGAGGKESSTDESESPEPPIAKGKKRAADDAEPAEPPKRKKRAPRGFKTLKNGEVVPSTPRVRPGKGKGKGKQKASEVAETGSGEEEAGQADAGSEDGAPSNRKDKRSKPNARQAIKIDPEEIENEVINARKPPAQLGANMTEEARERQRVRLDGYRAEVKKMHDQKHGKKNGKKTS